MDEDDAILAFSNTLPGNDDEPKLIEVDEHARQMEEDANKELNKLSSDDATCAFSVLA